MVTLTDTSDDEVDVHINDWMVEHHWAEFGKMVSIKNNFAFHHYQQCLRRKDYDSQNESIKSSDSLQSSGSYLKKKATLEKYKELFSNLSDCSSSLDEIVFISTTKNEENKNFPLENPFNRYKKLASKFLLNLHENQSSCSKDSKEKQNNCTVQDLHSSIELKSSNEEKNDFCKNNEQVSHTNDKIYDNDDFRGDNGGHGRMNPIDWSKAINDKNKASLSSSHSIINRLKKLSINTYKCM